MPAHETILNMLLTVLLLGGSHATTLTLPSLDDYAVAVTKQHNIHRANHTAPPLTWDADLAAIARKHAKSCRFRHTADDEKGAEYGENLAYWASSADVSDKMIDAARGAIDIGWYNREAPFFTEYGSATPSDLQSKGDTYGHFTQLVWKESSRLGCASYLCAPGTIKKDYQAWNTVCNYDPPGNVHGDFAENVLRPLGAAKEFVRSAAQRRGRAKAQREMETDSTITSTSSIL